MTTDGAIIRVLEICNKKGLHARASAKFVQTVERFNADVKVTRGAETVGYQLAKSIADAGHHVTLLGDMRRTPG